MKKIISKLIFGKMPETALETRRRILAKATNVKDSRWHEGKEFVQNKVTVFDKKAQ